MDMKKLVSLTIAFAMLAVSFAMVSNVMVSNVRGQITSASDNTTNLTLNAVFPKLYWINFTDAAFTTRLDQQVAVNADYYFGFEYNYSLGWDQCDFIVQAWYDNGMTNANYPAEGDNVRNLAFTLYCDPLDDAGAGAIPWNTTVQFPGGNREIISSGPALYANNSDNPYPKQDNWTVFIPVTFGPQIRAAEYDGGALGVPFSDDKLTALNNAFTWDFSVTVRDRIQTTATNTSWGEYGIQRMVSLAVSGNPTGNAPPGGSCTMAPYSNITYSSNSPYLVNITLESDLLINGVGPGAIPTANVLVQNMHPDAAGNSEIDVAQNVPAPFTNRTVWGTVGPITPIQSSGHGNMSAGPLSSDFLGPVYWTDLEWSVSVPAVQEGIYWTRIFVTIVT